MQHFLNNYRFFSSLNSGIVQTLTLRTLLSPIATVLGASYRVKVRIYRACVQSVLIYGTETWAMKADDLKSLERTKRMMVRWMCSVSLKDKKRRVDLCNLPIIELFGQRKLKHLHPALESI